MYFDHRSLIGQLVVLSVRFPSIRNNLNQHSPQRRIWNVRCSVPVRFHVQFIFPVFAKHSAFAEFQIHAGVLDGNVFLASGHFNGQPLARRRCCLCRRILLLRAVLCLAFLRVRLRGVRLRGVRLRIVLRLATRVHARCQRQCRTQSRNEKRAPQCPCHGISHMIVYAPSSTKTIRAVKPPPNRK